LATSLRISPSSTACEVLGEISPARRWVRACLDRRRAQQAVDLIGAEQAAWCYWLMRPTPSALAIERWK
jgi:hypothetical protein